MIVPMRSHVFRLKTLDSLEDDIERSCKELHVPRPVSGFLFAPPRRFRLDYAWVDRRLAIEVHDGMWPRGRRARRKAYIRYLQKCNLAMFLGWRVLRYTPTQIRYGRWQQDFIRVSQPVETSTVGALAS